MKNKYLCCLLIITFSLCLINVHSFSQDGSKTYKVKRGRVVVDKISYSIYRGVRVVKTNQHGGLTYEINLKSEKKAVKLAKKIIKFYLKKRIGRIKVGRFTKTAKPETIAWTAVSGKAHKGKGAMVIVSVGENMVRVMLFPFNDDSLFGMIL